MSNDSLKIVDEDDLDLVRRGGFQGNSRYAVLLQELKKLKPGKALVIPLGNNKIKNAHQKLGSALSRPSAPKPPAGYRWTKRTTADRKHITISLVEDTRPERVKKARALKKAK